MNRYNLMLIASLLFLLSACASPLPSPNLTQVKGKLVTRGTGIPVKDAALRLWKITGTENGFEISSAEQPTSETTTNVAGEFLFVDVPPGRYRLGGKFKIESRDVSLNLDEYNGDMSGKKPAIEVDAGQIIDLGILEHCPHQACGLPPTIIPIVIP